MHSLRTGAFQELEAALGEHLAEARSKHGPLAPALVIVPTTLLRLHLRRQLVNHLNLRFVTLAELVRALTPGAKPLPAFADELIAARIIEQGITEDSYFAPVKTAAGFRQGLLATLRDLKEAGIAPKQLASLAKSFGPKLEQLAALYAAYEKQLSARNVADDADRLAAAARAVPGFDFRLSTFDFRTVCLYGFYDFNHLQRRLIAAFASRFSLQVFVPWRDEPAFAFARPTVGWLEKELKTRRQPLNLKSQIPNPKSLQVLSVPGEARECREILREAFAFTGGGNRPLHEVAVLARGDEPYGPLLHDLATARDWPLHLAMGRRALDAIEPRLLLLLLDIAAEDFARSRVIEFATLSATTTSQAAEWDRLSAELGIVRGAGVWHDRVPSRAKQLQAKQSYADESEQPGIVRELAAARKLAAFIETLTRAAGRLPQQGKWSEFTAAMNLAAKDLMPASEPLEAALASLCALNALDDYQPVVTREEFARFARKAFESDTQPEGAFQMGGPFVGGIMAARGVTWPMVVVPGLVEKSWPRQLREDPILLDDERRDLNKRLPSDDDLPRLEEKVARGREEERMLFRLACGAARERLVITYPRLEPATGRPRVPSALLLETLGAANFTELEKDPRVRKVPLTPVVTAESEPLDIGEMDHRLLATLRDSRVRGVTPLLDAMSPTLTPGLLLEQTRWGGGNRWTAYDGCLARPESLDVLRRLFDPAKHRWAISRLETYARSPFSFFLREVLGIEGVEEPEDAETISAVDFGRLYHELLSNIVQRFQMGNLLPLDPARSVENEVVLEDEAAGVFKEFASRGVTGYPLVWRVKQEKIRADLLRWLGIEYALAAGGYSPVATEWAFGLAADPPPAQLKLDEKITLLVGGKIDRVDRGPGDELFVLDYKTGKIGKYRDKSFCRGRALQIPVYMLATEQLTGKPCGGGAYYFATRRGGFEKRGWVREDLAAADQRLREILGALVRSILAGKFFVTPDGAEAAGTAMTQAAVETLWELRRDDESIRDYRNATDDDKELAEEEEEAADE